MARSGRGFPTGAYVRIRRALDAPAGNTINLVGASTGTSSTVALGPVRDRLLVGASTGTSATSAPYTIPLVETLTETFAAAIDTGKWTASGVTSSGGQGVFATYDPGTSLTAVSTYALANSAIYFKIPTAPPATTGSHALSLNLVSRNGLQGVTLSVYSDSDGDNVDFYVADEDAGNPDEPYRGQAGGGTVFTLDVVANPWFKVSMVADVIEAWYSPNATSWTSFGSLDVSGEVGSRLYVALHNLAVSFTVGGSDNSVAVPVLDNVNAGTTLLTGSSTGTSTAAATPTRTRAADGSSTGTSSTATVGPVRDIAAVASATGTSSAANSAIAEERLLVGSSTGTSLAVGAEVDEKILIASSTGTSTVTGAIDAAYVVTASATGTSSTSASATRDSAAAATATGTSDTTVVGPVRDRAQDASSTGTSTAVNSAGPERDSTLSGSSTGTSLAVGAEEDEKILIATATGTSTATAAIDAAYVETGAATGTSTTTAAIANAQPVSASSTGTSTASGTPSSSAGAITIALYSFVTGGSTFTLNSTSAAAHITASAVTNGSLSSITAGPALTYATDPVLSATNTGTSTTAAAAITNNQYFTFTITPATDWVTTFSSITFNAARGGAANPRGFAIRSSADGYAADLVASTAVPTARPTFTAYDIPLTGLDLTAATTFRVYVFSPSTAQPVDFDDIALHGFVLSYKQEVGSSTGTSSTSAAISVERVLEGSASGSSSTSADATRTIDLSGSSTATSTATATATRSTALEASATGTSDAVGTLEVEATDISLSGDATGTSTASATLVNEMPLVATATGTSAATGAVARARTLTGASTGTSTTVALAGYTQRLTATATGAGTATGTPSRSRRLVTGADGRSSTVGRLVRLRLFAGSSTGTSAVSGTLSAVRLYNGSTVGTSSVTGRIRVISRDLVSDPTYIVLVDARDDAVTAIGGRTLETSTQIRAQSTTVNDRGVLVSVASRETST